MRENNRTRQLKIAVVTGAANGIGAAVVKQFMDAGQCRIIAVDRDEQGLERLQAEMGEAGSGCLHLCAVDLTDYDSTRERLHPVLEQYPGIDILVSSHGIADENRIGQSDVWDRVMAVNLTSTQRLLGAIEPRLADNGRVVVVSSILGRAGKLANSAYCASKHALLGLVKSIALDWAPRGITVNAVLPSWVDTPMLRRELKPQAEALGISTEQLLRRVKKRIPLRQLVSGADVANCIAFLVSPAASMITAQSIVIDGGYGCGV